MQKFERKTTEFQGGDVPRHFTDRMGRTDFIPKQQVRIVGVHDEDEDLWKVQLSDGNTYVVDGCELSPHPEATETNVELITRLMEWSSNGALMQAFIIEAVAKYAELVQQMPEDQQAKMNAGFIPYGPWKACADEALAEIKGRN